MDIMARHMILDRIRAFTNNNNGSSMCFSMNPNIIMTYVTAHPEIEWNWQYLSSNPGISFRDVIAHPEYPWKWTYISMNPSVRFFRCDEVSGQTVGLLLVKRESIRDN